MSTNTKTLYQNYIVEEFRIQKEPFYIPVNDEVQIFEAAYQSKIPILFKGPTGVGKTRFVEYMSYKLGANLTKIKQTSKTKSKSEVQLKQLKITK